MTIEATDGIVVVRDGQGYRATINEFADYLGLPAAKRVVTSGTTSGTQTPTSDTADIFIISGLTGGITIAEPSGSPAQGQQLILRIIDNGTARSIAWASGANGYRAIGGNLPATTVINKTLYVGCIYNATDLRWDVIAVAQQA
jgi:hypothetical protein